MLTNRQTILRTAVFVAAAVAIAFNFWFFRAPSQSGHRGARDAQEFPRVIPPEGFAFNDTHGKVPGDPDVAEKQMRQIYEKMNVYRARKGKLPLGDAATDFYFDMRRHPQAYGLKKASDADALLSNPDVKYSDEYRTFPDPNAVNPYLQPAQRPDGSPVGGSKEAGKRDVLAYTNIYFHPNERIFNDGHGTAAPVGFYLILWEDGQVARIPHDKVTYARPQRGPFPECFPGQAGVPKEAYSYMEAKKRTLPLNKDGSNPNVARR